MTATICLDHLKLNQTFEARSSPVNDVLRRAVFASRAGDQTVGSAAQDAMSFYSASVTVTMRMVLGGSDQNGAAQMVNRAEKAMKSILEVAFYFSRTGAQSAVAFPWVKLTLDVRQPLENRMIFGPSLRFHEV